jgi:hypothetical protein
VTFSTRRSRKKRAKKRNIPFSLNQEQIEQIFSNLENAKCQSCNRKFNTLIPNHNRFPSLDRINPFQGYVFENIAVICRQCNSSKSLFERDCSVSARNYIERCVTNWIATRFAVSGIMNSFGG